MAMKLPRETIDELEGLVDQLTKPDPNAREAAMQRLENHERSGRVPVEALVEFCDSDRPSLSMYAISALGRNGGPEALKKLVDLAERHREGNALILQTIVEALGETRSRDASSALLALLGIRTGWANKLFGRRGRKEDDDAPVAKNRDFITLPVLRALEQIEDPKAAELLGNYLEHDESLVRWHTVRLMMKCNQAQFAGRIKELSEKDSSDVVREIAEIAVEQLGVLPPNMNN